MRTTASTADKIAAHRATTAERRHTARLVETAALVNRHLDGYRGTDRPVGNPMGGFDLGKSARIITTDPEGACTIYAFSNDRAQIERWSASFAGDVPAAVLAATIIAAHGEHA